MKKWSLFILFCFYFVLIGKCLAYPKPAAVQKINDWTLKVLFEKPQQISIKIPGQKQPQRFWYIIINITNESNQDVPFYPSCDLLTDTFQIIPAGKKIWKNVFKEIKLRHQGKYPLLEFIDNVDNIILEGEDNARDIAIVWPDFDPNAKKVSLFLSGLSNETTVIQHPVKTDKDGNPEKIYLRKTLMLNYTIGGDETLRYLAKMAFEGQKWVMR